MKQATYSVCTICDIGCQVRVVSNNGKVERVLEHAEHAQHRPRFHEPARRAQLDQSI